MKTLLRVAAALMAVSTSAVATSALAADYPVRHPRYVQQYDEPLIIDYNHNYGPADFYPGTLAPPDRVVVPLTDRPYGIYDGFDRYCGQSSAHYRGQDGRHHPCN
jgi:hypothetical protein